MQCRRNTVIGMLLCVELPVSVFANSTDYTEMYPFDPEHGLTISTLGR